MLVFIGQLSPMSIDEYSQMSTHVPGYQSFSGFSATFCIGQIGHQHHKGSKIPLIYGTPSLLLQTLFILFIQSFLRGFAIFCIGQISHQQHMVKSSTYIRYPQTAVVVIVHIINLIISQGFCIMLYWPNWPPAA